MLRGGTSPRTGIPGLQGKQLSFDHIGSHVVANETADHFPSSLVAENGGDDFVGEAEIDETGAHRSAQVMRGKVRNRNVLATFDDERSNTVCRQRRARFGPKQRPLLDCLRVARDNLPGKTHERRHRGRPFFDRMAGGVHSQVCSSISAASS
jgi:hypothetical protein